MGWDFYGDKALGRDFIIAELTEGRDIAPQKVLDVAVRSNNVWRVIQREDGSTYIALDMMQSGRKLDCGWGVKGVSESMGPHVFDCPLRMLDAVPCPEGEYAERWRCIVREHHHAAAQRKAAAKKIVAGSKVMVYGKPYVVVGKNPRGRGWMVRDEAGKLYRAIGGIKLIA